MQECSKRATQSESPERHPNSWKILIQVPVHQDPTFSGSISSVALIREGDLALNLSQCSSVVVSPTATTPTLSEGGVKSKEVEIAGGKSKNVEAP